ncbi:MAG: Sir2 family transcriptional regulator [Methylococcaceae bacterium]|nr:Sir2 family transcriptional regulator [Methylococcaceae bacterium]
METQEIDGNDTPISEQNSNNILLAAKTIKAAETLLITAGAGIGVDSGLPDFRGNQGFWKVHPNYLKEGLSFADLANPKWFDRDPHKAWGFYGYRYQLYRDTLPHRGFQLLKKWQDQRVTPGFVVTSNVDGHFQKAGFAAASVHECHGSIHYLQCAESCRNKIWTLDALTFDIDPVNLVARGKLPTCPNCGKVARPNILMFGDYYWLPDRADLQRQSLILWQQKIIDRNIVTIEMGAGSTIASIRNYSENMPGKLIRINPREAQGPKGTLSISLPALAALEAIDLALANF